MNETIETTGTVTKVHGNNNYDVEIGSEDENKRVVPCYLSGKMSRHRINIIPGDEVTVEIPSPYTKGRITYRGQKLARAERSDKRPKGRGGKKRN